MGTIKDVEKLANKLLNEDFTIRDSIGTTRTLNAVKIGYTFKFDSAKRRFGSCNYVKKVITLSKPICMVNLNQIDGKITDTILHELAHAFCVEIFGIRNGRGHDYKWQNIAKQIGSNGKRCYSPSDFGGINAPQSKYTLTCPTCGKESGMHRRPKRSYSCGECSTNGYDAKHRLELTQNY